MTKETNLKRVRFLESERIFLTPLSVEDSENNHLWDNDRELALLDGGSFKPVAYDAVREQIESVAKRKDRLFFSIILNENGEHIGNICLFNLSDYHRVCHWGLKVAKHHWRSGYGSEAARLVIAYAFDDLGLHKLCSGCHASNIGSLKLQKSLGFVQEGCLRKERYIQGEYVDDIRFGMLKEEYLNSPIFKNRKTS